MMRTLLTLTCVLAASGADTATCALNGAEAVDEMLDSAVFIMASIERCENKDKIRCAMDVSSAIESVNAMINVILKAVNNCGSLNTANKDCGLAVGVLTRSFAGLSAGAAGIVAKCPNKANNFKPLVTVKDKLNAASKFGGKHASKAAGLAQGFGQCIVDVKEVIKSLFKGIKRIMTLKDNCADANSRRCVHNDLKVLAGFTEMGEFIAGALGQCSTDHSLSEDAECAQMSLRIVHHIENVNRAGVAMSKACHVGEAQRLYLEDDEASTTQEATSSSSVTMALAALLPITAVLSFVGGTRLAKSGTQPARDCESLMEDSQVE